MGTIPGRRKVNEPMASILTDSLARPCLRILQGSSKREESQTLGNICRVNIDLQTDL